MTAPRLIAMRGRATRPALRPHVARGEVVIGRIAPVSPTPTGPPPVIDIASRTAPRGWAAPVIDACAVALGRGVARLLVAGRPGGPGPRAAESRSVAPHGVLPAAGAVAPRTERPPLHLLRGGLRLDA